MKRYCKEQEKSPSGSNKGKPHAWPLLTKNILQSSSPFEKFLSAMRKGWLFFKTRLTTGKDPCMPALYLLTCFIASRLEWAVTRKLQWTAVWNDSSQMMRLQSSEQCSAMCVCVCNFASQEKRRWQRWRDRLFWTRSWFMTLSSKHFQDFSNIKITRIKEMSMWLIK